MFQINEGELHKHLQGVVVGAVEETLNQLLEAEADRLCQARRYERTDARKDTRAGHYDRSLETQAGEVTLHVPKLRNLPFETAIIERYRRRESSVEEALVEMYLAGVSVRRVEDITEALWGTRVSPSTVSDLNQKIYGRLEEWRNKPIEGKYPYLFLDGLCLKRSWGGEVRTVSILVAIGVNQDGYRDILGVAEGAKEDKESWRAFLRYLAKRGLGGVRLVTSDACQGLVEILGEFFPKALWQRCMVHFYRNVFTVVPKGKVRAVAGMLRAIYAQETRDEAIRKAKLVEEKLREMRLANAADLLRDGIPETLSYSRFPQEHWLKIRTNNPLERLLREIRRRTRVVGCFPDGQSALMLAAARLRHVAGSKWGLKRYMNVSMLLSEEVETAETTSMAG